MEEAEPRARHRRRTVKGRPHVHRSKANRVRRSDDASRPRRPWGRDAVMAAVLDAATALFAARGPASVSVRDIAAAAGVNHALVHRHFGAKHAVLQAVLERAAREMAAIAADIPDSRTGMGQLFAASVEHETYWRALARAILDGENPRSLQRDFPTIQRLIERLRTEQQSRQHAEPSSLPPPIDVRVIVGTLSALMLGWLVFEPYLLTAIGLDQHNRDEIRDQVVHVLEAMIDLAHQGPATQAGAKA